MPRLIFLSLLLYSTHLLAQRHFSYEIKGHIANFKPGEKVYFQHMTIDSAIIINGDFTFKGERTIDNEPEMNYNESVTWLYIDHSGSGINFYNLNIRPYPDRVTIYFEPGTTYINIIDSARKATIIPPKFNSGHYTLDSIYSSNFKNIDSIFKAAKKLQLTGSQFLKYETERRDLYWTEEKWELWQFVKNHPSSPVSLSVLAHDNNPYPDYDKIESYFEPITEDLKNTKFGKEYSAMLEKLKLVRIGADEPDFTMNNQYDKPVSLSSYHGKYVLIEFWASWNKISKQENQTIISALKQFGNQNFAAIGVSLDNNKDRWLKAITDDELTWTQISDLKAMNNAVALLYSVKTIPQNFLIDPSGKIIAKNLFGDDLIKYIQRIFKPAKPIVIE